MKDDDTPKQHRKDGSFWRKMDPVLRRLLGLEDDEIRYLVRRDDERLKDARRKITDELGPLDQYKRKEDRLAVARVLRLREKGLRANHLLDSVVRYPLAPMRIRALVHFTGNRSDLEAMGLEVRAQSQDIFTVTGTRDQLLDLAAEPACQRLRSPRMLYPEVEHASAQGEIDIVQSPPNSFGGAGVLVGIADSALDVTHHGFRDPTGTNDTRVIYYWVQQPHTYDALGNFQVQANPPGQTPEQWYLDNPATRPNFTGLNYGRLYTAADINTAIGLATPYGTGANQICCELDPGDPEHGTHCAGIAVGSGHEANLATAPTHIGAAPDATLVYVCLELYVGSLDRDAASEDTVLDALDFMYRVAQDEGMPISVSVSQGTSFGPHNGSSEFDQARDNMINSFMDRALTWSAGNDNNDAGYRAGSIGPGVTENFTLTSQRWPSGDTWLEIWYDGPELDYQVTFGGVSSGWRTAGQDYSGTLSGRDIDAGRDLDAGGGLHGIRLFFDNTVFNEVYTIELRNPHASQTANYHAWVGHQGWTASLSGSTQNELTLSDTACAKSILTVGACQKVLPPNPGAGEPIADYSGAGPTVDGRIKPELVAVGGTSAAPIMSADSDENSGYTSMQGTSMATPLVAGTTALFFEAYGAQGLDLNQDTIKALHTRHANRLNLILDPTQPGYTNHRNLFGYGRLRAVETIDLIQPPGEVDLWVRTAADDYGLEPYPGGCFCGAPDIRVCHAGTNNETTHISWGATYDVKVTVHNLGDSDATGSTVRLKYTLPHAAPNNWFEAEDASDQKLTQTVTVDAMDELEVVFSWRPEASELSAPAGQTHFCLLAEVDHAQDPLTYPAPTTAGGNAWTTNIKGTNNVALRNLHIE